jgi:hypothetical protein
MTIELRTTCPFCSEVHPLVTEARADGGAAPAAGDVAMCFSCGEFGVFARRGRLRVPTAAERREIACDPDLIRMQTAWRDTVK